MENNDPELLEIFHFSPEDHVDETLFDKYNRTSGKYLHVEDWKDVQVPEVIIGVGISEASNGAWRLAL